jgi:predicted MFS family arabinose efflux permease
MTTDAAATATLATSAPKDLPVSDRWRVMMYLSFLVMMLSFGAPNGGLIDIPISFFLKNKLHLRASDLALFRFASGAPLYFGFLWGFVRDIWNPFGRRDRGYMVLFGIICAACYAYFAFIPPSAGSLLVAVLVLTSGFLFVQSAQTGLGATIARQHVMTGQLSAVSNVVGSVAVLIPFFLGGRLSNLLESRNADQAARILFLVGAGVMLAIAIFAIWRPRVVYDNVHAEQREFHPIRDAVRLFRHWPVYPALAIWFLWNFAPGSVTPLQYYMQNTLHAADSDYANWQALFGVSFIPTFMIYGFLCRRVPLRRLLFWGTVIGVPQMIPLAFTPTVTTALIAAVPIGLMGGMASAAYLDLLIRSCPKGLEGTMIMAANALYFIVGRGGDILGTALYDHFKSFNVCVIAITIVYAAILPALLLVPRRLTATPDGVAPEGGFDAEVDKPRLASPV